MNIQIAILLAVVVILAAQVWFLFCDIESKKRSERQREKIIELTMVITECKEKQWETRRELNALHSDTKMLITKNIVTEGVSEHLRREIKELKSFLKENQSDIKDFENILSMLKNVERVVALEHNTYQGAIHGILERLGELDYKRQEFEGKYIPKADNVHIPGKGQ